MMLKQLSITFAVLLSGASLAQAQDANATAIVEQARAALGGAKLASATGLSIAGPYRRTMGDRDVSGDLSIDLQLPDRFLRTETMNLMGDAVVTRESGVNGEQLLQSSRTRGGGPGMMIRMGGGEGPNAEAQMLRSAKADFARHALALLLAAPGSASARFTYAGEAAGEDGKADAIDVKGADGFEARLFIDKTTHRPLLLSYQGVAPRLVMRMERGSGGPPPEPNAAPGRGAAPAPPDMVEMQIFFADYKPVDGVMLPHKITRSVGGQPSEEWDITKARVNPAFKADTFTKR